MCSKLGNFNIEALCVILDSPLLMSIPPLLNSVIMSLVTGMVLDFIFFLSFSTQLKRQIYRCSLSSNSLLELINYSSISFGSLYVTHCTGIHMLCRL